MGLLDWWKKKPPKEASEEEEDLPREDPEIYSGMRVEVTTQDGMLLFAAKMVGLRRDKAELYQYTESTVSQEAEPFQVQIRGYNDRKRKAVYMEGVITPKPKHIWQVEELKVVRLGNDRAFFRLDTDLDATITTFGGFNSGEIPCKMLNISVGGACVALSHVFHEHDKFLLKVKLLEDRDTSLMYCEVLRIIERKDKFEYGCRFLELNEADQDRITQNIFAVQLKERASSQ